MRDSTREKLFIKPEPTDAPEYKIISSGDRLANGNLLTTLLVNGETVVIIEFVNERDGFEVYKVAGKRTIESARKEMGLPPKEF